MSSADTVTVIIPAYNSQETIRRAIDSCSELDGCRIIVVDDGSVDSTADVARAAGAEVLHQTNSGASVARQTGLRGATTEFVIFLDADDELIPAGVLDSLLILNQQPTAGVAAGRVIGVTPNGRERLLQRSYALVNTQELLSKGYGPWPPAASVIRRETLSETESLDIPLLGTRYAEDYEMLIRLSLAGSVIMHDNPSTRYRLFAGKSSKAPVQAIRDKESIRRYYAELLRRPVALLNEREISMAASMRAARSSAANGAWLTAAGWLVRSVAASPSLVVRKIRVRLNTCRTMPRT